MSKVKIGNLFALRNLGVDDNGKPMWNGEPFISEGGSLPVVDYADELPEHPQDGESVIVLNGSAPGLVYPDPEESDMFQEQRIRFYGRDVQIGSPNFTNRHPVYNSDLFASQSIMEMLGIFLSTTARLDFVGNNIEDMVFKIMPVVNDIQSNIYTDAGITLDEDELIVDPNATTNYVIFAEIIADYSYTNKDKILEIDSTHISAPLLLVLAFEDITTEVGTLRSGWNVLNAIVEYIDGNYGEVTGLTIDAGVDVNDYIVLSPEIVGGTLSIHGVTATIPTFKDLICDVSGLSNGLYLYLNSRWKRCLMV